MNKKIKIMLTTMAIGSISPIVTTSNGQEIITNYSGEDRYETSVNISKKNINNANMIILASGENFADALCASPLSIQEKAPILLTKPNRLPLSVKKEIDRLTPKKIIIFGGPSSINEDIKKELEKSYSVERISGSDRYKTSLKAYEFKKSLNPKSTKIGLASGTNFADALVAAPFIADKGSIILANKNDNSKVKADYIFGGENTLPGYKGITRFAGKDRFETALKIAKEFKGKNIILSDGMNYPDALSASILSAINKAPIILTNKKEIPATVKDYLKNKKKENIITVGGKNSVPSNLDFIENNDTGYSSGGGGSSHKPNKKPKEYKVNFASDQLREQINTALKRKNNLIDESKVLSDIDVKKYEPSNKELENLKTLSLRSLNQKYDENFNTIDIDVPDKSLKGLEEAKNLERLIISYGNLDNLEAIKNLSKLKDLRLMHLNLTSLPNLNKLSDLEAIYLNNNNLNTLSGIENLKNLKILSALGNNISSISELKDLNKLEKISLSENKITSLDGIANKENLIELNATYNDLTDTPSD